MWFVHCTLSLAVGVALCVVCTLHTVTCGWRGFVCGLYTAHSLAVGMALCVVCTLHTHLQLAWLCLWFVHCTLSLAVGMALSVVCAELCCDPVKICFLLLAGGCGQRPVLSKRLRMLWKWEDLGTL